jgi:hypothetical protein
MKINDVSSNADSKLYLDEQYFSIQDQGMIFDILRNKMYSDPISAICREVSCNARDAHREVGTPDKPIQISLPNSVDPFLKIKDFGPGISPDRISNIFIKYAASTKRNDNVQTGGFGLGAKTPFSYSDSFNIVTVVDNIKYNYVCFIDDTKIGKISLLSQESVSEPNGTEIVVPIKKYDYELFSQAVNNCTHHWSVKPIIKGNDSFSYKEKNILLEATNWQLLTSSSYKEFKAIVDEIEYSIPLNTLKTFNQSSLIDSFIGDIYLKFGVGELSLSANREQIYFDPTTKQKINSAIDSLKEDIVNLIKLEVSSSKNLWEANIIYQKFIVRNFVRNFRNVTCFPNFSWNGFKLNEQPIVRLECPVSYFTRGGRYSRYSAPNPNKISMSNSNNLNFIENSTLMINNLDRDITPKQLKKYFESNPTVKSVQLIRPHTNNGKVTLDYLNANFHLNQFNPKLVSDYVSVSNRSNKSSSSRLIIYKYFASSSESINIGFKQVASNLVEQDTNKKIICKLNKSYNNEKEVRIKEKFIPNNFIRKFLLSNPEYTLYGVDSNIPESKIDDYFADAETLEEVIESKVFEDESLDFNLINYACRNINKISTNLISNRLNFIQKINDSNSLYLQKINLNQKLYDLAYNKSHLLDLYYLVADSDALNADEFIKNNPEYDINSINEKVYQKYPLLKHIDNHHSSVFDYIVQYINLIDKN